jgi:dUTPase
MFLSAKKGGGFEPRRQAKLRLTGGHGGRLQPPFQMSAASAASAPAAAPKYKLWLVVEDEDFKKAPYYDYSVELNDENLNAGFDLFTAEEFSGPGPALVSLGVRAMMTRMDTGETVHYWLAPRSSIYKTGYIMANSLGVIDRSYRGVLKAPVVLCAAQAGEGAAAGVLKRGDRHFQILAPDMGHIAVIVRCSELPATARGDGGFGSTGN